MERWAREPLSTANPERSPDAPVVATEPLQTPGSVAPPAPGVGRATAISAAQVLALQRTVGNAAVTQLISRAPPDAGAPLAGAPAAPATPPAPATPAPSATPTPSATANPAASPDKPYAGPSVEQGKLGDVEIPLGTWTFANADSVHDKWAKKIEGLKLFSLPVPIPDIPGLVVRLEGSGAAHARFSAGYGPGQMRDVKIGLSTAQAAIIAGGALAGLIIPGAVAGSLYELYKGPFRGIGEVSMPASMEIALGISGSLRAAVEAGGAVDLVALEAGVSADTKAKAKLEIPPTKVGLYWEDGDLSFDTHALELALSVALDLQLNAFISLEIAKLWDWRREWNLAATPIDFAWPFKPSVRVHNDRGTGKAAGAAPPAGSDFRASIGAKMGAAIGETLIEFAVGSEDLNAEKAGEILSRGMKKAVADNVAPTRRGGANGGGGAGGKGKHQAPTGEEDDPIEMKWAKPLGQYENPVWLHLRDEGTTPFYINKKKQLPNGKTLGVDEGNFGKVGKKFQRLDKTDRDGAAKEREFKQDLEDQSFEWDDWSPDHVLDLAWGGDNDYSNIWPLDRYTNMEAGKYHNWGQKARFNLPEDPPEAPAREEALNWAPFAMVPKRWFRITEVVAPP